MADEILGGLYEMLVLVALEDHARVLQRGEAVFWHMAPPGVAIEPDLTIGVEHARPRIILLVSHTNAERASEKKFWRNIGEYVDTRLALGSKVLVSNIVFDSGQKRRLAAASLALFDSFLEVDRTPYGAELVAFCTTLASNRSFRNASETARLPIVRQSLRGAQRASAAVSRLGRELEGLVRQSAGRTNWPSAFAAASKGRPRRRLPTPRQTSLRRGLGRLLPIADEKELREVVQSVRKGSAYPWPAYFEPLGLTGPSLKGRVVKDREVRWPASALPEDAIANLWRLARRSSRALLQACKGIERIENTAVFHRFVVSRYADLCRHTRLRRALLDCYANPGSVLGVKMDVKDAAHQNLWLFDYVMQIIKAQTGKQQGYGYTRLAAECGFRFEIAATAGVVLSPFLQRAKPLKPELLDGIATALARRLSLVGLDWVRANEALVATFALRGLFEDKIYKISAFDPLGDLLKVALDGRAAVEHPRHPTFLTEFAGPGAASCYVIKCRDVALMWQTAHGGHCNDKTKELLGRAAMLAALASPEIKKIGLLIDGDWTQKHLDSLVSAGYDGVFYPDELDELVAWVEE